MLIKSRLRPQSFDERVLEPLTPHATGVDRVHLGSRKDVTVITWNQHGSSIYTMESGKHHKSGVSPWRRATLSQLSLDFLPKWQLKRTLRITVRKPLRLNSCYSTKNVGIVKPFLVKQNKPNAKLENSVNSPILHQSRAPKHKHFFSCSKAVWDKPGLSDSHLEQTLNKGSGQDSRTYFCNVVSYIWCWDQSSSFNKKIVRWVILRE